MKHWKLYTLALAAAAALSVTACDPEAGLSAEQENRIQNIEQESETQELSEIEIPPYSGEPYVFINDNIPFFAEKDQTEEAFELYSDLDDLGRCGTAYASIGRELMPREARGEIREVKPSGWHSIRFEFVDGEALYTRCPLIAWQLAAENANEKNLITGTRYMNTEGMLPFEEITGDYVRRTGNHVVYRVTPIFEGENLVASGVLMEGMSVEDQGRDIRFCVYAYNVQPGVVINYRSGKSTLADDWQDVESEYENTYVLNTYRKRFHRPSCDSVYEMSRSNREDYQGSREELIEQGYDPCGNCRP